MANGCERWSKKEGLASEGQVPRYCAGNHLRALWISMSVSQRSSTALLSYHYTCGVNTVNGTCGLSLAAALTHYVTA